MAGRAPLLALRLPDGRFHYAARPWHFLYFFPLPHQQGSLRPGIFGSEPSFMVSGGVLGRDRNPGEGGGSVGAVRQSAFGRWVMYKVIN